MELISIKGSTAKIYRVEGGFIFKTPWNPKNKDSSAEFENAISVEKQILEKLGGYPGIIQYHGPYYAEGLKDGLLLSEANCGDLQSYIDTYGDEIDNALRRQWSLQLAKAVAYVHENGILHMDISTTNVLLHKVHQPTEVSVNAILADFGGSRCVQLGLDGGLAPDDPYRDPQLKLTDFDTPKVDLFSLGVVIYIIMTGHYPFYQRPAPENDDMHAYGAHVQKLYQEGRFPDLSSVELGDIIAGCCCERRFDTAKHVVAALEAEMQCYAP